MGGRGAWQAEAIGAPPHTHTHHPGSHQAHPYSEKRKAACYQAPAIPHQTRSRFGGRRK